MVGTIAPEGTGQHLGKGKLRRARGGDWRIWRPKVSRNLEPPGGTMPPTPSTLDGQSWDSLSWLPLNANMAAVSILMRVKRGRIGTPKILEICPIGSVSGKNGTEFSECVVDAREHGREGTQGMAGQATECNSVLRFRRRRVM